MLRSQRYYRYTGEVRDGHGRVIVAIVFAHQRTNQMTSVRHEYRTDNNCRAPRAKDLSGHDVILRGVIIITRNICSNCMFFLLYLISNK